MAKRELVKIETLQGEEPNSKIYIMTCYIGGLDTYQRAKATKRFIDSETKVLEMVLETDLRNILRVNGIIPYDGTELALNDAFNKLAIKGKNIEIRDRYYELNGEKIIGESPNKMTIIEEGDTLSCAMEIILHEEIHA